jgi:hypothetical protein
MKSWKNLSWKDMMGVIPQPDYLTGAINLVTERAQTCGAQHKRPRVDCWFNTNPAARQYADEVSTCEEQHIAIHRAHPIDDAVRPACHLLRCFASGTTVTEKLPPRPFFTDFRPGSALILAIIPLDEVRVDFSNN